MEEQASIRLVGVPSVLTLPEVDVSTLVLRVHWYSPVQCVLKRFHDSSVQ